MPYHHTTAARFAGRLACAPVESLVRVDVTAPGVFESGGLQRGLAVRAGAGVADFIRPTLTPDI